MTALCGMLRAAKGQVGGPDGAAGLGLERTTLISRMTKLGISSKTRHKTFDTFRHRHQQPRHLDSARNAGQLWFPLQTNDLRGLASL